MKTDSLIVKKTETLQVKIEPSLKQALVQKVGARGVSMRVRALIRAFVQSKKVKP